MTDEQPACGASQRLDKWLWHARFARTRTAAARLVRDGHVRVNATRATSCARAVQAGDILTVAQERHVRVVRARGPAPRRGSAKDAQQLYDDLTDGSRDKPTGRQLDDPKHSQLDEATAPGCLAPPDQSR